MRIMMSAAASPVAPGIIRHLQMLGHYVIGHDMLPFGKGIADKFLVTPPIGSMQLSRFADFLIENDVELYIPFLDDELPLVAEITLAVCSNADTIDIFGSKRRQCEAMALAGLSVAPTVHNVMLKPNHGHGGRGILKFGNYVAQQEIIGTEFTIDVLTGDDGEFLFAVPRHRVVANGVSVVGKVMMDHELIDLAEDVVERFRFWGPINIQAIRENETGKLYIIEVNARLSGSCMFTVMAGFDILDATIRLHEGKPFIPPTKVEEIMVRRYYVEERI